MARIPHARRICVGPLFSATCLRGECMLCNLSEAINIDYIAEASHHFGMERDFLLGRINDYGCAEVQYNV